MSYDEHVDIWAADTADLYCRLPHLSATSRQATAIWRELVIRICRDLDDGPWS
jgi:hypothetical protein